MYVKAGQLSASSIFKSCRKLASTKQSANQNVFSLYFFGDLRPAGASRIQPAIRAFTSGSVQVARQHQLESHFIGGSGEAETDAGFDVDSFFRFAIRHCP